MSSPAPGSVLPGRPRPISPANAQHVGRRDSQQDAFGFSNLDNPVFASHAGYLAVLADGMGGMQNGAWASIQAVRIFIEAYQAKTEAETPQAALRRALRIANGVVHEEATRLDLVDRMGTTLVAAVVRDLELHWVNVGDSRAYLFEGGHLVCLSTDHSYAEVLRERVSKGEISTSEALSHPMRNSLTSYLGRPEPLQLSGSEHPLRLQPGAWVLLCSDGLSGVLSDAEMGAHLHGSAQSACDRLLQAAIDRGLPNQDNTTVVVVHVPAPGGAPQTASVSRAVYPPPRADNAAAVPARLPLWRQPVAWLGSAAAAMAALLLGVALWPAPANEAIPVVLAADAPTGGSAAGAGAPAEPAVRHGYATDPSGLVVAPPPVVAAKPAVASRPGKPVASAGGPAASAAVSPAASAASGAGAVGAPQPAATAAAPGKPGVAAQPPSAGVTPTSPNVAPNAAGVTPPAKAPASAAVPPANAVEAGDAKGKLAGPPSTQRQDLGP